MLEIMNESQRPLDWFEVLAAGSDELATLHVMADGGDQAAEAAGLFLDDTAYLPMSSEDIKSISYLDQESALHNWRISRTLPEFALLAGTIVVLRSYEQDQSFVPGDFSWPNRSR